MATYKRPLIDKHSNTIHPITCTKAVYDDDGVELDEILRKASYRLQISTNSVVISKEVNNAVLTVKLFSGTADVTNLFCNDDYLFVWTRESTDSSSDITWNNNSSHYGHSKTSITIGNNDILHSATFVCTLYNYNNVSHTREDVVSTDRIEIIDLSDRGLISSYINSNSPRTQIYNSSTNEYIPDFTQNPLILTPVVYLDQDNVPLGSTGLTITWKRKVNDTESDLIQAETVSSIGVLTVNDNILDNNTPYIVYVAHIQYRNPNTGYVLQTESSSDISMVTSGLVGETAVVFSIYAPQGTVFSNREGSRTIQTAAYYGQTVISSATYRWYKYVNGDYSLIQDATSSSYTVYGSDVDGQATFKCIMTYQTVDYTDVITLIDKTDNYQVVIDSTSGDIFRNSSGDTCLVAGLYQNGEIVDPLKCNSYNDFVKTLPSPPYQEGEYCHKINVNSGNMPLMRSNGTAWVDVTNVDEYKYSKIYKWYRRDANGDPMDNGNPYATGKVIYVKYDSSSSKITFTCEVFESRNNVEEQISAGNYTISSIIDPVISGDEPSNPIEGMLWIDTTHTPNEMKIYRNGSWIPVGASDEDKSKVFTSQPITPYRVGDLWLRQDSNGENVIYYCNNARNSGSYVASDWIPATDYQTSHDVTQELDNFSDTIIDPLSQRIDSKIETWFQTTNPESTWYQPSATPPVDKRSEHVGDMWFDNTTDNVKLQRYSYTLATGYIWEEITNQDAIDAYTKAQEAEDLADGKRRVFYGSPDAPTSFTPTPPYDEGDLWAQGDGGSILVCINAKSDEEIYSSSDWSDASRYDNFIDVDYVTDKQVLQTQIDGKIQTWFQDLDPVNYPGIMGFTSTGSIVVSMGSNSENFSKSPTGHERESGTYRFIYDNNGWYLASSGGDLISIELSDYGISIISGTPSSGNEIIITYQKPEDLPVWSTAVKSRHNGDLWYAPTTKILKRYRDYGNNVFDWELIQDADAVQALTNAANAQATADGKCMTFYIKNVITYSTSGEITVGIVESEWNNVVNESGRYVFSYDGSKWILNITYPDSSTDGPYDVDISEYGIKVSGNPDSNSIVTVDFVYNHPNPPYDIGDLWIQGESGEILVCNVSKSSGSTFSRDDWDYSNALNEFINVTYKEDLINLEGLIDNKIDNWFQVSDPQDAWITVDTKKSHIGDSWYKDNDHIYRYSDDLQWIIYDNTNDPPESGQTIGPIRRAYISAANAKDTSDGKRRVFIGSSNPTPPYDRGDLWMQGSNGGILYCNTSRISGQSYVSGDFVTASNYKDYQIHIGSTAPTDTSLMWLDTTISSNPVLKQCTNPSANPPVWSVVGETTKIYTSQPTPPYNAGDMYIYTLDNTTMVYICTTSRDTGDYNPDDWVSQSSEDQIYIAPTPPTDISKLWIDTNSQPYVLKYYSNGEWVNIGSVQDLSELQQEIEQIRGQITELSSVMDSYDQLIQVCNATTNRSDLVVSIERSSWLGSSLEYGTYEFSYNGTNWILNSNVVTLSDYYLTITSGTPTDGDEITVTYYTTKSVLGFSVKNYEETYETVNGNIETLLEQKRIQDQYFDFTDGFTVGTSENKSAVNIKNTGVTLRDNEGNDALNITTAGVNTKTVNVSNSLNMAITSVMILGNYRIDFTNSGMSIVWNA